MVLTNQKRKHQPWNQAPQTSAHVKVEILLIWLTKLRFETSIFKCVCLHHIIWAMKFNCWPIWPVWKCTLLVYCDTLSLSRFLPWPCFLGFFFFTIGPSSLLSFSFFSFWKGGRGSWPPHTTNDSCNLHNLLPLCEPPWNPSRMVTMAIGLQDTKSSSDGLQNPTITPDLVVPNGYMAPNNYGCSTVTQCKDTPSIVMHF